MGQCLILIFCIIQRILASTNWKPNIDKYQFWFNNEARIVEKTMQKGDLNRTVLYPIDFVDQLLDSNMLYLKTKTDLHNLNLKYDVITRKKRSLQNIYFPLANYSWGELFRGIPFYKGNEGVVSRHRHRRQQILPLMILGIVVFGIVVIPTGFQFLAVLGGKAFLMAKLALLLASINGLKRVASSGVHYGLYHTDGGNYHQLTPAVAPISSHFWHDRDGTVNA